MKSSILVYFLIFLYSIFNVKAQNNSLFVEKEVSLAYEKGTRSFDGKPGKNYFQNRTDYKINVDFDPYSRLLKGNENITFTNNSPDTLIRIVIRLNANILKKGSARNFSIDPNDVTEGVVISKLKVGDFEFDLENKPPYLDVNNLYVRLKDPLPPLAQTELELDWSYTFQANSNIREGRYHETTYFIAYWYPKIAVYDDIYGWNRHIYNGEQEFYNEYGNFDVNITVPSGFYVWSSGVLQNAKEVLNPDKLKLFNESKTSDSVIHILTEKDFEKEDLPNSSGNKTWKFTAENLPDFAFALSDTYLWDATSVKINDKRVHVHAVYYKNSKDFFEVAEISRHTIRLLSEKVMGVGFPYPQMTAFNGHYGMEFPMMVNDGDGKTRNETLFVTSHEISHTYFPFFVGVNEERHAWIDEGFATFLPKEIEDSLSLDEDYNSFESNLRTYSRLAGGKYDLPLMVPSDQMTGTNYRFATYGRSAVSFYVLKNILGPKVFQECLVTFINRWAGKHPTPYDFFFAVEDVSGLNLNWFWNPWFFEFGYPDLAVKGASQKENMLNVQVEKVASFPTPVNLVVSYEDGSTQLFYESAAIWADGKTSKTLSYKIKKSVKSIEIDPTTVPDSNGDNNTFTMD